MLLWGRVKQAGFFRVPGMKAYKENMISWHGYYLQILVCNVSYSLLNWQAPFQKEKTSVVSKSLDHEDLNQ